MFTSVIKQSKKQGQSLTVLQLQALSSMYNKTSGVSNSTILYDTVD